MTDTAASRPDDAESRQSFWEDVHGGKHVDEVSWWQSVPELSLDLVDKAGIERGDGVVDVGAGWSTLVDFLLERGFTDVSAIDLSASALQTVRDISGWQVDHDTLTLHFAQSTLPGYRGIPDEVFQRALYMTEAFTRQG